MPTQYRYVYLYLREVGDMSDDRMYETLHYISLYEHFQKAAMQTQTLMLS